MFTYTNTTRQPRAGDLFFTKDANNNAKWRLNVIDAIDVDDDGETFARSGEGEYMGFVLYVYPENPAHLNTVDRTGQTIEVGDEVVLVRNSPQSPFFVVGKTVVDDYTTWVLRSNEGVRMSDVSSTDITIVNKLKKGGGNYLTGSKILKGDLVVVSGQDPLFKTPARVKGIVECTGQIIIVSDHNCIVVDPKYLTLKERMFARSAEVLLKDDAGERIRVVYTVGSAVDISHVTIVKSGGDTFFVDIDDLELLKK